MKPKPRNIKLREQTSGVFFWGRQNQSQTNTEIGPVLSKINSKPRGGGRGAGRVHGGSGGGGTVLLRELGRPQEDGGARDGGLAKPDCNGATKNTQYPGKTTSV